MVEQAGVLLCQRAEPDWLENAYQQAYRVIAAAQEQILLTMCPTGEVPAR